MQAGEEEGGRRTVGAELQAGDNILVAEEALSELRCVHPAQLERWNGRSEEAQQTQPMNWGERKGYSCPSDHR